jgi:hypothetical protein
VGAERTHHAGDLACNKSKLFFQRGLDRQITLKPLQKITPGLATQ